ncbi:D-Ala-D-Ala carboxypeptidase family metallohydrolase [Sphingomicrobium aestuariivivum]|uniref:D-Ala-D-Ala carboxypeptidase family metallohydrolase n=1 Tax=Sphingomicrobium aestuariivivum TaxID=1582356 RepID=UPI001FD6B475|nr:D-Ala-D-Ala carboxypeptidase family metallohydrolase [Sphingomicrobium aestuariivivum]MCJ8190922.1 D-Ala-D-Ala carboxypeptidase family metallohydrolase [Sphingomicrobium aestuariivivum]
MSLVTAMLLAMAPVAPTLPDTAADYIEPGQDFAGYNAWRANNPARQAEIDAYFSYLDTSGVGDVVPKWQLLRTASSWRECNQPPYEVPPRQNWDGIVNTLRYLGEAVKPAVGEMEVLSGYRNPYLNSCAGGSARSVHRTNIALDVVPRYPFDRNELMSRLCTIHARYGRRYDAGFGFYVGIRFHVDAWKYRIWGVTEEEGGRQCGIALQRREAARIDQF